MKHSLIAFLIFFSLNIALHAQHGGNSLGIGAVNYVEVPDNTDGSLDVGVAFTFEAWIFNFGGNSNQKVAGKLAADFINGFIFGVEDLQVNVEVFDNAGTNNKLKTGAVSQIGWTHVACTYEVGGMLAIFINGKKAGETAVSPDAVNFNTNPFRIGIAPWDVNALGFTGYIDEVRYWLTALDEGTLKAWMHKDVTDQHPDFANLTLYHKYNETMGPLLADETIYGNDGTLSTLNGPVLEPFFLPFKGDFDLYENDVQGVWNAKLTGSSDIMSVEAMLFDTVEVEHTAVFSHSDGDYSITTDGAPTTYARLSKIWRVTTQGAFLINLHFDLSPIDLTGIDEVVLLSSETDDFTDASVLEGDFDGNSFTINDEAFQDGYYYTLGFATSVAAEEKQDDGFNFRISPNPNEGIFVLNFEESPGELDAKIYDRLGRAVWQNVLPATQGRHTIDVAGVMNPGIYTIKLLYKNGKTASQRLVVD